MVFKQKDSEEPQVRALELRIKQSSDLKKRACFEKSLAMLRAGVRGEKRSAFHIDFTLEDSREWAVIHDLRVAWNGRVAQIDHILINCFLELFVIESKNFRKKIRYENGGWERLNADNYWEGNESPVEQNERHIFVLKGLIESHQLAPTALGLSPHFINIVAVQGSCSIIGKLPPKTKVERIDTLVRKLKEQEPSNLWLLKTVPPETLHAFAKTLVTYHQPVEPPKSSEVLHDVPASATQPTKMASGHNAPPLTTPSKSPAVDKPSPKTCQACSRTLSAAEINYCNVHESRFEGRRLCRACQPPQPRPQETTLQIKIAPRAPQTATPPQNPAPRPVKATQSGAAKEQTWEERMNEIKLAHPRAYEEWTIAEDNRLRDLFTQRATIPAIANALQRQPTAIRARLKKFNLLPTASGRAVLDI